MQDALPVILKVRMNFDYPSRINIELTNCCNLACSTCMRHGWDEELGEMELRLAERIIDEAAGMPGPPLVFFGGFGEPLTYRGVEGLIRRASEAGCRTGLITNGILLGEEVSEALVDAGLDMLWVSIDGATPESFADIRLGDHLTEILRNLESFRGVVRRRRRGSGGVRRTPGLGFATVLMKRNLHELPALLQIARRLKVSRIVTTNIDPHDEASADERLYADELYGGADMEPRISLPRMDPDREVLDALGTLLRGGARTDFGHMEYRGVSDLCPFVEERSVSVRWDGEVAPCLPLLHDHESRINDHYRTVRAASFGRLAACGEVTAETASAVDGAPPVDPTPSAEAAPAADAKTPHRRLIDVWRDPDYVDFRQRLDDFNFSPCTLCDSCDFAYGNEEDCFGNLHPTCGGCLWAQGFIRCP